MTDDPAYPGEPEGNGYIERWMKTLKEQCLWARLYENVDDLRQAVVDFTELYNSKWLIQLHGHMTPREAHRAAMTRPSRMNAHALVSKNVQGTGCATRVTPRFGAQVRR